MITSPCWKVKRISQVCEFAKITTFRRVYSSLGSLRHIWGVILLPFLLTPLLALWLSTGTSPARAQGVYVTPTPLPAIVDKQNAAVQAQAAANATLSQAAQMRAAAAEMERNGIAQYAQAQADITTAREAAATQNGVAAGEAIGRLGATVDEQNKTVTGQARIISTLTTDNELTARQVISLTAENESLRTQVQSLKTDKQTILDNFNATSKALDDSQRQSGAVPIVTLVIGVLFSAIVAVLLVVVLQRRRDAPPHDDSHDDAIDAEYTTTQPKDEADNDTSASGTL